MAFEVIRPIHPFPARMAPELALRSLKTLDPGSVVLDPMAGSGTVLRHALELGHRAIGFDMDPLAVLMSRVWTTSVDHSEVRTLLTEIVSDARDVKLRTTRLEWIDSSVETKEFIRYWFADQQRRDLRRLAVVLHEKQRSLRSESRLAALDVLRLAVSRMIVTKEMGASLARDTSHSRPHKVADQSDYKVFAGFERSTNQLLARLEIASNRSRASVSIGDVRALSLRASSVDAVITSPPYLNAIDYLRGHRLALVWLGHGLEELRGIRSASIGSERAAEEVKEDIVAIRRAMLNGQEIPRQLGPMVDRYALDLLRMSRQIARVLKSGGSAMFVVGNSCVRGCYVNNASGLAKAAALSGLKHVHRKERELPSASRYLPVTGEALSKRMRTETVLKYSK